MGFDLGELYIGLRADREQLSRDLDSAKRDTRDFASDAERSLDRVNIGDGLTRGLDGKLRDARGRFVAEATIIGRQGGTAAGNAYTAAMGTQLESRAYGMGRGIGSRLTSGLKTAAFGSGALAAYLGVDTIRDSLAEARDAQKIAATTAQIIESTGGAAKLTANQIGDMAGAISKATGIDDEEIQGAQNLLLTFKNVKNEVGQGSDIFTRASKATADLSKAGFGDLNGAAKQLGKALNDPVKGITALSRAGVTFDAVQTERIKKLVEEGDLLTAQKIILGEVESQVGGVAAAQATLSDKSTVAAGNLKEQFGTTLLPLLEDVQRGFLRSQPTIEGWIDTFGSKGVPALRGFFAEFRDEGIPAIQELGDELGPLVRETLPVAETLLGTTAEVVKTTAPAVTSMLKAFNDLPDWARSALALSVGAGVVANKARPLLDMFSGPGGLFSRGSSPVNPLYVSQVGSGGGGGGLTGLLSGFLKRAGIPIAAAYGAYTVGNGIAQIGPSDYVRDNSIVNKRGLTTSLAKSEIGANAELLGIDLGKLRRSLITGDGTYVQDVRDKLIAESTGPMATAEQAFSQYTGIQTSGNAALQAIEDFDEITTDWARAVATSTKRYRDGRKDRIGDMLSAESGDRTNGNNLLLGPLGLKDTKGKVDDLNKSLDNTTTASKTAIDSLGEVLKAVAEIPRVVPVEITVEMASRVNTQVLDFLKSPFGGGGTGTAAEPTGGGSPFDELYRYTEEQSGRAVSASETRAGIDHRALY